MDLPHNLVWATASVAGAVLLLMAVSSMRRRLRDVLRSKLLGSVVLGLLALDLVTFSGLKPPPAPQWRGDLRTGDLSQWGAVHEARPEAVTVTEAPGDGYALSARFEVEPGDRTFDQTEEERAELASTVEDTGAVEGAETWTGWSTFFPDGTQVPQDGWMLVSQWHQTADTCPPNVAIYITDGDSPHMLFTVRGGAIDLDTCEVEHKRDYDLGPLPTGRWVDFKVHAVWSSDEDQGSMSVELDGERVVDDVPSANLFDGQDAYFKQGVYRSNSEATTVVYHSGATVGASADSIPLRACGGSALRRLLDRAAAWC